MTIQIMYKIGFTRPSLIQETVLVAKFICNHDFHNRLEWPLLKQTIIDDNLMQTRTIRSSEIIIDEIFKRFSLLNNSQIALISYDNSQDVKQLIWVALCRQYLFIADFTAEVLIPAYVNLRSHIEYDDYRVFLNSKADSHPELDRVSEKTHSNARQALFQMMRQCDILSNENQFIPQTISIALQNCSLESDLAFIPGAIRL